jgi:hypothetical protein
MMNDVGLGVTTLQLYLMAEAVIVFVGRGF